MYFLHIFVLYFLFNNHTIAKIKYCDGSFMAVFAVLCFLQNFIGLQYYEKQKIKQAFIIYNVGITKNSK